MARWREAALPLLLFALLGAAPWIGFGEGYVLTLLARAMILGIAALGLHLLVGGAGLVSLGHAALLGLGAYAVVALDAARITEALWVAPAAIGGGALFALLTGAVAVRTSGVQFIMITLAFAQMAFFTAGSLSVYGGDDGYTLYGRTEILGRRWLEDRLVFHYLCLGLLAASWGLVVAILASRFGRVLRAARENALRVAALGFNPAPYRLLAYVIAGGMAGLAGALLANATEFVAPSYLAWQRSGDLLFMVILGGLGAPHGAVLGALAIVLLEEWLGHWTAHWRLIFGPLLILSVLFLKGGLAGLPAQLRGAGRG
ncbi:branched-chain amino acid ABC transporter permease [Siccirubricoccus sp. KC 17139]|uniref:Branched-chain amino acid ABC transporter permease n=1 Tax=Siccirubricoccus soli TaxID=2899147 RepID=A0ABT1D0W4_9PROT|nr:branched-chain amino acid ABC transporter permease [Siccirubricoccus soli]MCO6415550.1 branched-chain amino acid ABC transporter permease [Siccirubricoccus soli]MCP2681682.1 branched-chain amino acid ABC transporter permease [Siccirubricoccus soli]